MRTGASVGRGYGPLVVARAPMSLEDLRGCTVALPGEWTTAALVFRLFAPECRIVQRPFDAILDDVAAGRADAGVLIHEGQLTYASAGLHKVVDLGERWRTETELPLPLGLDVVRRDLGPSLAAEASHALRRSIEYACANEAAAIDYALQYGRGLDRELGRKFVGMYVNDDTMDLGDEGERALRELYTRGAAAGIVPAVGRLEIVG
jgi:1,4-dihydroxy-6-naphthoate synthase